MFLSSATGPYIQEEECIKIRASMKMASLLWRLVGGGENKDYDKIKVNSVLGPLNYNSGCAFHRPVL
jgi:hypothetical protein